jgi:hypothetical protein
LRLLPCRRSLPATCRLTSFAAALSPSCLSSGR